MISSSFRYTQLLLLSIVLLLVGGLYGCKYAVFDRASDVCNHTDVKLAFSVDGLTPVVKNRASLSAEEENEIEDLWIFIEGEPQPGGPPSIQKLHFVMDEGDNIPPLTDIPGVTLSSRGTILVLANTISNKVAFGAKPLEDAINQCRTIGDVLSISIGLRDDNIYPTEGKLLMWGALYYDIQLGRGVTVAEDGSKKVIVPLRRSLTKITVNVKSDFPTTGAEGQDIQTTLNLKSWHPYGLTQAVDHFHIEDIDAERMNSIYILPSNPLNYLRMEDQPFEEPGNTFTFYMLPYGPNNDNNDNNEQPAVDANDPDYYEKLIKHYHPSSPGPGIEGFTANTPNGKGTNERDGYGVKFPAFTYIMPVVRIDAQIDQREVSTAHGTASGKPIYSANVKYYFNIGEHIDEGGNKHPFQIRRNHHYIYNLTIKGVNQIVTEVEDLGPDWDYQNNYEPNTAYDGDVYISSREILRDAPFGTALITFTQEAFANVDVVVDGGDHGTGWLKFMRNPPIQRSQLLPYPGDDSPSLMSVEEIVKQLNDPDFYDPDTRTATFSVYFDEFYYPNNLQDCLNAPDRVIVIAPKSEIKKVSADKLSSVSRAVYTFRQKAPYTPYDISKISNNNLGIAIEVIENPKLNCKENNAGVYGWPECEQPWAGYFAFKHSLSGYFKGIGAETNYTWDDFVKIQGDSYVVNPQNLYIREMEAQLGCMTMNRDLNGNGKIDPGEIRWYAPAFEEMALFTLAQHDMSPEARIGVLGKPDSFKHYITSTKAGHFRLNKMSYWGELGLVTTEQAHDPQIRGEGKTGSQDRSYDYVTNESEYGQGKIYYRCVRVIGGDDDAATYTRLEQKDRRGKNPVEFVPKPYTYTGTGQPGDPYKIHINFGENDKVLRPIYMKVRGQLPDHTQNSLYARPVQDFYVAKEVVNYTGEYYSVPEEGGAGKFVQVKNKKTFTYKEVQEIQPCKHYREGAGEDKEWRLPNAAELHIMAYTLVKPGSLVPLDRYESYNMGWTNVTSGEYDRNEPGMQDRRIYWSSTHMEAANGVSYRYALGKGILMPTITIVRPSNVSGYVRCVKDVR